MFGCIPALTQLLLAANLFQNMDDTTFLHRYIPLLKLMTKNEEKVETKK